MDRNCPLLVVNISFPIDHDNIVNNMYTCCRGFYLRTLRNLDTDYTDVIKS